MSEEITHPGIGVGALILNQDKKVLLLLRQGSHGAGTWSLPGGHLEFGETIFQTAIREVKEEVGLEARDCELISVYDELDYLPNKHNLNIGVKVNRFEGVPQNLEPHKCASLDWFDIDTLPTPLFPSTQAILKNYQSGKIFNYTNSGKKV